MPEPLFIFLSYSSWILSLQNLRLSVIQAICHLTPHRWVILIYSLFIPLNFRISFLSPILNNVSSIVTKTHRVLLRWPPVPLPLRNGPCRCGSYQSYDVGLKNTFRVGIIPILYLLQLFPSWHSLNLFLALSIYGSRCATPVICCSSWSYQNLGRSYYFFASFAFLMRLNFLRGFSLRQLFANLMISQNDSVQ